MNHHETPTGAVLVLTRKKNIVGRVGGTKRAAVSLQIFRVPDREKRNRTELREIRNLGKSVKLPHAHVNQLKRTARGIKTTRIKGGRKYLKPRLSLSD